MSVWNHEQFYSNFCPSFNNCHRFSTPPPFSEHRMNDPRVPSMPPRPPPPPVWHHLATRPPPVGPGCLPVLPPFLRNVPPPPFVPVANWCPSRNVTPPFTGMPGPPNIPPPQNGHRLATDRFHHIQGFAPNRPPPNYPATNLPRTDFSVPNCTPPFHRLPNYARPNMRFSTMDHQSRSPLSVNTFRQRQPSFGDHCRNFQTKRHLNAGYNKGKNKRRKLNSHEKPENYSFFCDRCDRGFKTEEKYSEHTAQHEKCKVKGCLYVAAPRLVEIHYHLQHRTGLAAKIWQCESKDDIQKWISERKRNYPSAENIARKAREREERKVRGELLNNKHNRWCDRRMRGCRAGRNRHHNDNTWRNTRNNNKLNTTTAELENSATVKADDVDDVGRLHSETPVTGHTVGSHCNTSGRHSNENSVSHQRRSAVSHRKTQPRRPSLLAKLLTTDIRHERNVVLQCIRFLAQHYELHEKDRHYRDTQSRTLFVVSDNCGVVNGDSVELCEDANMSRCDRQLSQCSAMHDVTVDTDISRQVSGRECSMYNDDGCDIKPSTNADMIAVTADTVTHCHC